MIPTPLRTRATYAKYKVQKKKSLAELPVIQKYKHWTLVKNEYPYDRIASVHHMLVTVRERTTLETLLKDEVLELATIFKKLNKSKKYDAIWLAFPHSMTYKRQLHFHLLRIKRSS